MERKRSAESTIAGYLYQFDKSMIEILSQEDKNKDLIIEGVEDIDIDSLDDLNPSSIQVKYYAKSVYRTSEIKEPIQHMFNHFKSVLKDKLKRRNYYLYAHFKEGTEKLKVCDNKRLVTQDNKSALQFLKEDVLTTKNKSGEVVKQLFLDDDIEITDEDLQEFISLLVIDLEAVDINNQYRSLLEIIQREVENCKDIDDAENYYYNNALKVIFNIAIKTSEEGVKIEEDYRSLKDELSDIKAKIKYRENQITRGKGDIASHTDAKTTLEIEKKELEDKLNQEDFLKKAQEKHIEIRRINKRDFLNLIDGKALLFNKWFAWHRGKSNYYDYIIEKLKNTKALSNTKYKYLYINNKYFSDIKLEISFTELVANIIADSYGLNEALSKNKVWTIILDQKQDEIIRLKKELIKKKLRFNDGNESWYDFDVNHFNEEPLIYTDKNSIITQANYQIKLISLENFKKNLREIDCIDVLICFGEGLEAKDVYEFHNPSIFKIEDTKDFSGLNDIVKIFNVKSINNKFFRILSVAPDSIQIEVTDPIRFKNLNEKFSLGSYVKITDELNEVLIGIIKNYRIKDMNDHNEGMNIKQKNPSFILEVQPIGYIQQNRFHRGSNNITLPPNQVEIVDQDLLSNIFSQEIKEKEFCFSLLPGSVGENNKLIDVVLDGNSFFNKHLAVLGSTGSGKSCTVAKILHEGIKPFTVEQKEGILNNSHIIIFDIHGEYGNSFKEKCRMLTVDKIKLPYWLMNSEELENFFLDIEGHNQQNIFKRAITLNKKFHSKDEEGNFKDEITYDSPVFFDISEVIQYIKNYNISKEKNGEIIFNLEGKIINDNIENQEKGILFQPLEEVAKATGITKTTFNGDLTGFINRLETKINDDRLKFLLNKGQKFECELSDIIKQLIGYEYESDGTVNENKNVVIVDLSGMPFEVINHIVSLISRLIFNFAFHRKK